MTTVNKEIADAIVRGEYSADGATRVVQYQTWWHTIAYGVTFRDESKRKYMVQTEYIVSPVIYWDLERDGYNFSNHDQQEQKS